VRVFDLVVIALEGDALAGQKAARDRHHLLQVVDLCLSLGPQLSSRATTGTDADWVVKLIDVYPDEVPSQPEMGRTMALEMM